MLYKGKKIKNLALISGFCALVIILLAVTLLSPRKTKASSMFDFGGMHLSTSPCTCPASAGNSLIYITDYKTDSTLSLVYSPYSSKLYSNYNFESATYMLGSYTPGAGVGLCLEAGDPCTTMESDGLINTLPGFGTSAS